MFNYIEDKQKSNKNNDIKVIFMDSLFTFFKDNLTIAFKNYFNFSGRATRKEYFSVLIAIFALFIPASILLIVPVLGGLIFAVYTLAVILPVLAITSRRLHDVNKPFWYVLVPFGLVVLAFVGYLYAFAVGSFGLITVSNIIGAFSALFNAYIAYLVVLPSDPNSTFGPSQNLPVPLKLEFIVALKKVYLKNYFNFKGRAGRAEFWWPTYFFTFIFGSLVKFLNVIPLLGVAISIIVTLAVIVPNIAVAVRRLHDVNKSGFFVLIPYAGLAIGVLLYISAFSSPYEIGYFKILLGTVFAIAGFVVYIVLTIKSSDTTENRFGPVPDDIGYKTKSNSSAVLESASDN